MNRPSSPSSARSRGLTLVELLAGLVVLGTLLTMVVTARGRFVEQWADADKKLAATRELESRVTSWIDRPTSMPRVPSEGPLTTVPTHRWRTQYVADPAATDLFTRVVRVEVLPARSTRSHSKPLVAVEFLLRDDRLAPATQPTTPTQPAEAPTP